MKGSSVAQDSPDLLEIADGADMEGGKVKAAMALEMLSSRISGGGGGIFDKIADGPKPLPQAEVFVDACGSSLSADHKQPLSSNTSYHSKKINRSLLRHRTSAVSTPLDQVSILGGHREAYCKKLTSLLVGTSAGLHNTEDKGMRNIMGCLNMIQDLKYIEEDEDLTATRFRYWMENHLQPTSQIYGRDGDKENIINWLLSDKSSSVSVMDGSTRSNLSVMSIVGIAGVGKTTLAKFVYTDPIICEHFSARGWIHRADSLNCGRLLKTIFSSITGKPCDSKEPNHIQTVLREELKSKRLLLVLDDIEDLSISLLENLQVTLSGVKIGKIITTSRNVENASISKHSSFYHLDCLQPKVSWDLLCHCALDINPNTKKKLILFGKKLINNCMGLPLAVKILGRLLVYQSNDWTWSNVLESEAWKLEAKGTGILPILKLSYYLMPIYLQPCFLYCSMFPKGYKFDKYELVSLWMAQGYIESEGSRRVENVAFEYFFQLKRLSLFDESWDGGFVMHDLLHDLAKSISKGDCCAIEESDMGGISNGFHHLLVTGSELVSPLETPMALQTFLYRNLDDRPAMSLSSLFGMTMRNLRALELMCHGGAGVLMEMLHDKYLNVDCTLLHLRYLKLCDESMVRLPESICQLHNLEMMILDKCFNLNELPSDIGNLSMLRYIGLSETSIQMLPESICQLSDLQSLVLNYCRNLTELPDGIRELKKLKYVGLCGTGIKRLPESVCCLSKLPIWKLDYCKMLLELPDRIGDLVNLQFLGVTHTNINRLPESVCRLSNLLILDMTCSNLLDLPGGIGNLSNLSYLGLSHTNIRVLPESMCQLSGLHTLKLNGCRNLSRLPSGIGALTGLHHLILSDTDITVLPESLCQLSNLQTLELDGCRRCHSLPGDMGDLINLGRLELSDTDISELPTSFCRLSNLVTLELNGCYRLSQLPDNIGDLSNLHELEITETEIRELPKSLCHLAMLRKLKLNGNKNLEEFPPGIENLNNLTHLELVEVGIKKLPEHVSKLTKLVKLSFESKEKPTVGFSKHKHDH